MSQVRVPEGMRVWYLHKRSREPGFPRSVSAPILPRGGETEALLFEEGQHPRKDPPIAKGNAICSKHDNYNKRIGRDIALGRAVKGLDRV